MLHKLKTMTITTMRFLSTMAILLAGDEPGFKDSLVENGGGLVDSEESDTTMTSLIVIM